jgi:hypothetical protein
MVVQLERVPPLALDLRASQYQQVSDFVAEGVKGAVARVHNLANPFKTCCQRDRLSHGHSNRVGLFNPRGAQPYLQWVVV